LDGNGIGIDVFPYEGLRKDQIIDDISHFPFNDECFESVTFIANINHIPIQLRDIELAEAFRCLRYNGNIIITMGNPVAEFLIHNVVKYYDKFFKTNHDMDSERGMMEDEKYYLLDDEIMSLLKNARFKNIKKKYFLTQWGLNHLFIGWKFH
jgi:ubiquinone/menaquinone biosynthesis C-methylase UbiE